VAVGFGAQHLVRDVIAGFFMILENQVRVGDVAVINGTGGLVERVNFRTIVLRDLSGVVHTFPNGTINTLANVTREWSAFVFEFGVAYKEDTDRVVEVLTRVGAELRQDPHFGALMLDDVEIFGVDRFADSAVVIKGRIRTLPIKQWDVGREFQRRVKKAFDQTGIEIPFPHLSVYFGEASKPFMAQLVKGAPEQNNG
jgi:moderate conductance mechanosensitive channel